MISFRDSSFFSTKFETFAFENHELSRAQFHDSSHLFCIIIQFSFNLIFFWSSSFSRSDIAKKQHSRVQHFFAIFAYFETRDRERTLNVANKKIIEILNLTSESNDCRRRTSDFKFIDNKILKFVRSRKSNFSSMFVRIQRYKTNIVAQNEKTQKMRIWLKSFFNSSFIWVNVSIVDSSIFFLDDFRKTTLIDLDCER